MFKFKKPKRQTPVPLEFILARKQCTLRELCTQLGLAYNDELIQHLDTHDIEVPMWLIEEIEAEKTSVKKTSPTKKKVEPVRLKQKKKVSPRKKKTTTPPPVSEPLNEPVDEPVVESVVEVDATGEWDTTSMVIN